MQAAFYTSTGDAHQVLQVGDRPTPEPGPGEVRVRVRFSGINPSDVKSRSGTVGRSAGLPLVIPHSDGAGLIDMVGTGVAPARIGQRVWIYNGQWQRQCGTAAEFIVLPAAQAVPLPDGTSLRDAACLGIPAMTALVAVLHAACSVGSSVLIQGGAGAVGQYAIQFARRRGATVLSTVSSPQKAAQARAAGAQTVIDYRTESVVERVRAATQERGVDAVIDVNFSANHLQDIEILAPAGRIIVYGAADDTAALPLRRLRGLNAVLHFMRVYDIPATLRAQALNLLAEYLAQGELRHNVARCYPLEQIADAHDAVDSGAVIGNVVLDLDPGGVD